MRKKIEEAIKTTLVVENKESIHYAIDKILLLLDVSKSESIEREALAKLSKWAVSQKDCPSEFQDIVNKEFWNLI